MTQVKASAVGEAQALLTEVAPRGKITNGADAYLFDMRGPALMTALLNEVAQLREVLDDAEAAMSAAIPHVPRDLEIALRERVKAARAALQPKAEGEGEGNDGK